MISLAQVKKLELRVREVVDVLRVQSTENASLRQRINELETELDELRNEISSHRADEKQIEAGLQGVFDMLDQVDGSNGTSDNGKLQSGNDADPDVDETNSDTRPFLEDTGNNHDTQTSDDNPSPAESDANSIPNDEIHHSNNSESKDVSSDDDRFQSEFDIF